MKKKLYTIVQEIWEDVNPNNIDENTLNYLVDNQILIEKDHCFDNTYIPNPKISISSSVNLIATLLFPEIVSILILKDGEIDYFTHPTIEEASQFRKRNRERYASFSRVLNNE